MSFLKKPTAALLICLLLVAMSTYLSVNVKLGGECDRVTDGFYTGKLYKGQQEESISGQLEELIRLTDAMELTASRYDRDFDDVSDAREDMQHCLIYYRSDISDLYETYEELIAAMKELYAELIDEHLSAEDETALNELMNAVSDVQAAVRSSNYNESVRKYLLSYEKFPTEQMGKFARVDVPQYFY